MLLGTMSDTTYKSETLEHLGLVAGMFDELGIGDLVDELVPQDLSQRKVSVGQALKAMVLNGLGFANRRLYLMPEFFRNKPTERLVGAGHRTGPGMQTDSAARRDRGRSLVCLPLWPERPRLAAEQGLDAAIHRRQPTAARTPGFVM